MTAIFISHNSVDTREAVALKRWLTDNGWADVFLDIDVKDGLSPGERWKDALRLAADRCEAVLCLVSPAWLASAECKLEFRFAEQLRKLLFLAIIKPCEPKDLPPDWQWCPLYGEGAQTTLRFEFREQPAEYAFLSSGLERLKNGLEKAGISAEHFPWPPANDPDRAPYRGLKPLEAADAAVFFGRNAQTLHGMETLWDMRRTGLERLMVILGASGSGKSSFMRAGLLPRLARDDRRFFPLPVIRPRNAVLFGAEGLAPAFAAAFAGLGRNLTLGAIEKELNAGPEAFEALLAKLEQRLLEQRPPEPIAGEAEPQPPSLVFPIDQAEELFNADGVAEATPFLNLLGRLLRDRDESNQPAGPHRRALVVLTSRSDRYERLQIAPGLSEIKRRLFDLRPLPPGRFERVINGPAERATQAGRKLKIEPRLTERLLADFSEGADTLSLLGFALEKLYNKYASDGDLILEEYEGIRGRHETAQAAIFQEAIDSALAEPYRPPAISTERTEQYQGLRRAFIPYLARINPESNEPMRHVAKLTDLPADVHPLVERLVEARLLIRDKDAIEVAHESLLRQWPSLRGWLTEDLDKLRLLENIRQSAAEWQEENRHADLLVHRDGRLKDAETLLATPGYVVAADSDERAYLHACTAAQQARETALKEEQERRIRDAERIAEEQRLRVRSTRIGLGVAVVLLAIAVLAGLQARQSTLEAKRETLRADAGRLAAQGQTVLPDDPRLSLALAMEAITLHKGQPVVTAAEQLLRNALYRLAEPSQKATTNVESVVLHSDTRELRSALNRSPAPAFIRLRTPGPLHGYGVAFSPDGKWLASINGTQKIRVWALSAGEEMRSDLDAREVYDLAFSQNGRLLVAAMGPQGASLWDLNSGAFVRLRHGTDVNAVAFSDDGRWLATAGWSGSVRLWDLRNANEATVFALGLESYIANDVHSEDLTSGSLGDIRNVAFTSDSRRLVAAGESGVIRIWNISQSGSIDFIDLPHGEVALAVALSSGGRVAAGGASGSISLWDLTAADPLRTRVNLAGHVGDVSAVVFVRGNLLATAGADGTVRLWDTTAPEPTFTAVVLSGHDEAPIYRMALSSDGRWLATNAGHGDVRLWLLMPAELMALAANVGRNLSPGEWRRYFPGVEYRRTFSNLDVPADAPQQTARIVSGP